MKKIEVGIIGAAGYTAGELIRILGRHPYIKIGWLLSESQTGKLVSEVHTDLIGETTQKFTHEIQACDILFICKGHGESKKVLQSYPQLLDTKIIDLSQDFRIKGKHDFIYGLPEFYKKEVSNATHIANPGCFATSIQLAILPAMIEDIVQSDIHISGITGSTGAGQTFSQTSHFSWRNNNAGVYRALNHQHIEECEASVKRACSSFSNHLHFIPYRGAFTRGIVTTSYFKSTIETDKLMKIYNDSYQSSPFTFLTDYNPDIKMVVNTNKALVYVQKVNDYVIIVCVIDNLLKGASGQAVQNMNLLFDWEETAGLLLKPAVF